MRPKLTKKQRAYVRSKAISPEVTARDMATHYLQHNRTRILIYSNLGAAVHDAFVTGFHAGRRTGLIR